VLRALLHALHKDNRGQDLSEYCLLTAVVALIGLAIFIHFSGGIQNIWSGAGSALATANGNTAPASTGAATASSPSGNSQ
jgi:Flp pilus assembly pilin Flp